MGPRLLAAMAVGLVGAAPGAAQTHQVHLGLGVQWTFPPEQGVALTVEMGAGLLPESTRSALSGRGILGRDRAPVPAELWTRIDARRLPRWILGVRAGPMFGARVECSTYRNGLRTMAATGLALRHRAPPAGYFGVTADMLWSVDVGAFVGPSPLGGRPGWSDPHAGLGVRVPLLADVCPVF